MSTAVLGLRGPSRRWTMAHLHRPCDHQHLQLLVSLLEPTIDRLGERQVVGSGRNIGWCLRRSRHRSGICKPSEKTETFEERDEEAGIHFRQRVMCVPVLLVVLRELASHCSCLPVECHGAENILPCRTQPCICANPTSLKNVDAKL
jgi:hypothetical protein